MTTLRLGELSNEPDLKRTSATGFEGENQRARNLVLWGFIIMFFGAVLGIIGKKLVHDDIVTVVGVVTALAGMFLVVYPYLSPSPQKKKTSTAEPAVLTPPQSTEYLPHESNIAYLPSITERTTNLLKEPATKKPQPEEDEDSKM